MKPNFNNCLDIKGHRFFTKEICPYYCHFLHTKGLKIPGPMTSLSCQQALRSYCSNIYTVAQSQNQPYLINVPEPA